MSVDQVLAAHYAAPTFAADVDASLVVLGHDPQHITVNDLEPIDEFHMGGRAATRAVFSAATFVRGARVLDIGAGLGGPGRVAASEFGLIVDGIDLTPAYVAVANELSRRVGLADRVRLAAGNALALTFADHTFDGAFTIHVGMNIADKAQMMREARRVLKPGARFAIYDIMRAGDGDLTFPLPWSSVAETSAVARPAAYRAALDAAGFDILSESDMRPLLRQVAATTGGSMTPPLLPFRGASWETKTGNLASHVKGGVLAPTLIIANARAGTITT